MELLELIAEGDKVVGCFTCSATHPGAWLGQAPTGRRFERVDEVWILLARTANSPTQARPRSGPQLVRPSIQRLLDAMTGAPAHVRTGRLDILSLNRPGAALYGPVLDSQRLPVNLARFLFLDPAANDIYVDWDKTANDAVAILRGEAGRNPMTGGCRISWGSSRLAARPSGPDGPPTMSGYTAPARKQLHHPVAGDLELTYEALELPADAGLTMITYTAEPGSTSQVALDFLASWARAWTGSTGQRRLRRPTTPDPTGPRPGRPITRSEMELLFKQPKESS